MIARGALACVLTLCLAGPALARPEAPQVANEAAAALGEAAASLAVAEKASDRIEALTQTIRAYETGLSAMREGLRQAVLEERALSERLGEQDTEIAGLLTALERASLAGRAQATLHPGTALDTVRAGMLAASVVPALEARSAVLERDLTDLAALRAVREAGTSVLEDGLAGVREARLALSRAMSERTALPPGIATDAAAMEALINSSETLAAFADSLSRDTEPSAKVPEPWALPVMGEVLRGFGEADAEGTRRPGWIVASKAEALVTSPSDATVRFSGDVPGSGPVVILEPDPGQMVILSGLGTRFARTGEIVAKGTPVGLMDGDTTAEQQNLNDSALLGGQPWTETLYIEIRQGQAPVDPAAYFRPNED